MKKLKYVFLGIVWVILTLVLVEVTCRLLTCSDTILNITGLVVGLCTFTEVLYVVNSVFDNKFNKD